MSRLPPMPAESHPASPPAGAGGRWALRLLGDVVLTGPAGEPRHLPGRTAAALLAQLAMAPDRAHARETLIDQLWPEANLAVGRNRLRQLLSTVKTALRAEPGQPALLMAERQTLRLRPATLICDVVAFEAAVRSGRPADARALYRGELMPGHGEAWVHEERLRLAALADALDKPAPGPAAPAADEAVAPQETLLARHLPAYLTRLHGADAQVARLLLDVQAHRLVSVLGPGGHGKTRLAVEVAQALAAAPAGPSPGRQPQHFDLVAFVPLVACAGGPGATDAVLAALLLALHQDAKQALPVAQWPQLQRLLAGRRTLLVLDNAEQLVDEIGPLLADLLSACPGLHLLVTSRRALGLDGEQQRPLPPLPLPATGPYRSAAGAGTLTNPAVALFIDRARAVRPDFEPDLAQADAVAALVQHLQGMPLAIELAASHVANLSPTALLRLLQGPAGSSPGLRLLARSGPRAGGDPRHASMLGVVRWSWQLLSPAARLLLPRLSVVAGSFSLDTAVALAQSAPLDAALALQELVAHSMLRAEPGRDRYAMFELIREFAASVLPSEDLAPLRQRHRQWLIGWFGQLPLSTPLQQIRPEVPNLAAALIGAEADGAYGEAAALASAAQTALSAITLPEPALAALQRSADRLDDPVQQAVTRAGLARTWLLTGQTGPALHLALQALAQLPGRDAMPGAPAAPQPAGLARAVVLTRVAHVLWRLQRDARASAWLDEALALASQAGAQGLQATILTNQGALLRSAHPAASIGLQRRAVAAWAAAGDAHGVNVGRCNLAIALLARRDGAAEAVALAGQAMRDTRSQGDDMQHALACNLYGEAWSRLGQWAQAACAYRDCISMAYTAAEPWPLVYGLWNLPRALAHLRQPELAALLMGFSQAHSLQVTGGHTAGDHHDLRRLRRLCQAQLGAARTQAAWQAGAALSLTEAVQRALQRPA